MKIGLHYSFQVDPSADGRGTASQTAIREGLEDIAWADVNGFSSVMFASHHFMDDCWIPRPLQMATAAAAITRNVRVGTDIIILPLHHPVAVAEEAAMADIISNGRFILGVGLGWKENEYAGFGVPYKQRARIYERSIGHIQSLLKGQTVSDADGHYRFENAQVRPQPVNPNGVPFWMGGIQDVALMRIARLGDAWVMGPGAPLEHLQKQQRVLKDARTTAGRPAFADWPLRREAFIADSEDKAWALYAPGLRHEYGVVYRGLYQGYPDNDTVLNLRKWGEKLFLVGTPATVAAQLKTFQQGLGATECLIRYQLPMIDRGALKDTLHGLKDVIGLMPSAVIDTREQP